MGHTKWHVLDTFRKNPWSTTIEIAELLDIPVSNARTWVYKLRYQGMLRRKFYRWSFHTREYVYDLTKSAKNFLIKYDLPRFACMDNAWYDAEHQMGRKWTFIDDEDDSDD